MVVLTSFSQPTDGIRHRQPNTTVFVNDNSMGKGTLFIAESRLSWISDLGSGFSLEYPHISLHAISRDLTAFPQECLFLMLDTALGDENEENEEEEHENGSDEMGTTELRLVPDDKGMLDAMFHAMNACQALHPDPEDTFSEEDLYEDADEEIPMEETDHRMAGLRLENIDAAAGRRTGIEDTAGGNGSSGNCWSNFGRVGCECIEEYREGGRVGDRAEDKEEDMAEDMGEDRNCTEEDMEEDREVGTVVDRVVDRVEDRVGDREGFSSYSRIDEAQPDTRTSLGDINPSRMAGSPHIASRIVPEDNSFVDEH